MNSVLLTIQKISAPIVIFGGTAWIIVEKSFGYGVGYLLLSGIVYSIFIGIEYLIEKKLLPERFSWHAR